VKERLRKIYRKSTLATKIRYSYIALLIPFVLFLVYCIYNWWSSNKMYENMINSTIVASEFNLDFKDDFDHETYLLIVENKTMQESELTNLLNEANRIVTGLERLTDSEESQKRLDSVKRYLKNLEIYKGRIAENLAIGNKYEENRQIWENDVMIVTSLLQDDFFQYIYYEIRDIERASAEYKSVFVTMITISIAIFFGILLLILFLSYKIPLSITSPIRRLSEVTDQVAKGNLNVRANAKSGAEVAALSESMNTMIDKINELLEQVTKEQMRLRKAEFELLQAQINPHFLYNTLDTIVWLAEAGEHKKVVSMVGSLSDFFRSTLNQGKDIVSIKEELQHVRSYLEIQQVRYQDILEYEIDVPEELEGYLIPKITIQPLVENALYHGIKNKRGLGKITITGNATDEGFELWVQDNGIGITEERLSKVQERLEVGTQPSEDIYGVYNVNERIRLNFGEQYGIQIQSKYGEGTRVKIYLPCQVEKNQQES